MPKLKSRDEFLEFGLPPHVCGVILNWDQGQDHCLTHFDSFEMRLVSQTEARRLFSCHPAAVYLICCGGVARDLSRPWQLNA